MRKQSTGFEEWDRIEYRLANEDIVEFGGEQFVVGGGSVLWKKGRWWMVHHARRFEQREAA
ncbi:hypothetical protein [Phyllobacterium leguminum]|uniref:hypothetical protein n=1 Tax=Phyllobacterium leguminum TaxID=314237 RepID=UPI0011B7AD86|nr:hypothetical protein [Phyllobacterium leguminum]